MTPFDMGEHRLCVRCGQRQYRDTSWSKWKKLASGVANGVAQDSTR